MTALPSKTDVYGLFHLVENQSGSTSRYNETLEQLAVIATKVIQNRGYNDSDDITPVDGEMWFIDGSGSSDWQGYDNQLAVRTNGKWSFHEIGDYDFFYVLSDGASSVNSLERVDNTGGSPSWASI